MRYAFTTSDALPDVIDLSIARTWVRVDGDDVMLRILIRAAMQWAEKWCDQPLFKRDFTVNMPSFCSEGTLPGINPIITSVTYDTLTESDLVLDSPGYSLSNRSIFSFINGQVSGLSPTGVRVNYTAGYDIDTLPEDLMLALLYEANNGYENRSNPVSERRTAAENKLQGYKLY